MNAELGTRNAEQKQAGLTQKVREAIARICTDKQSLSMPQEFTSQEIGAVLDVRTYRDRRAALGYVLKDLRKSGEIVAVRRGVYVHVPKIRPRGKMDVIWHLIRSHKHFTTDEIERLSGAARATVLEYLRCLKALGYLRQAKRGGSWLMIKDPGPEAPANTAKCEKLRKLRKSNGTHE